MCDFAYDIVPSYYPTYVEYEDGNGWNAMSLNIQFDIVDDGGCRDAEFFACLLFADPVVINLSADV